MIDPILFCVCLDDRRTSRSNLPGKCSACNRKSHSLAYKMYLFGRSYSVNRAWETSKWDKEFPSALFHHSQHDDDDEDDEGYHFKRKE